MNKTIFEILERLLHKKYKAFENQDLYCEYTEDYFAINCAVNWHKYINKNYYRWIIPFVREHLENAGFTGYFYFNEYVVKVGDQPLNS